jgi:D-cysteine desulfhydrase family pyridoxal phosphate-dependent enzyme
MTIDHSASSLQLLLTAWAPRGYGLYPTPFHHLARFSEAVGREVWIKRDDLITVAAGGNKVRKLGYLVADALAHGADHLVSVGAEQSNHARCVAAVAALEGLACDLVLGGDPKTPIVGNLLLDHMLGASVHFPGTDDWAHLERVSEGLAEQLREAGRRPYVMPIGGSTPIGALGFVDAYLELREQMAAADVRPSAIVHATSSGGTQSGLAVGAHLLQDDVRVLGIGVAKTAGDLQAEIGDITEGCLDLLGGDAGAPDITVVPGYLGRAYAEPTEGALHALRLLFRTEGILLDPVYTAKAMHAVIDAPNGVLGDGPIVFWHTGGMPAVFAPHFAPDLTG